MKIHAIYLLVVFILCLNPSGFSQDHHFPKITPAGKGKVNTRIDNIGYWIRMARFGYVEANPWRQVPPALKRSSPIRAGGLLVQDSPDVAVISGDAVTQSENSIFIDPEDETILLNSNNSSDWNGSFATTLYGCDRFWSFDAASTWGGSVYGVGQLNSGDPATAIGRNGWWYVGKINNANGQSVAYSTDHGQTWTDVTVAEVGGGFGDLLDKNHLWIDNSEESPYQGNLYAGWSCYVDASPDENQIEIARSADHGLSWSFPAGISHAVNAGTHNQGVNIQTGPYGEVYAAWSIYDSWPADESAIGFARSADGGVNWLPATRIITNIKGIRASGTGKDMRVASFPVMTVDMSEGPGKGNLYVVWANTGVPGINTGTDIDIYIIRSSDNGATWSGPVRVNQDPPGLGKEHFLPWITCDPLNGSLCVIYYDDRDVDSTKAETWVSWSYDAGESWADFRVSDVAFTPIPIAGMAAGYFGDYIGIKAQNMKVFPIWTDNRDGNALTYVSPFDLGPPPGQPYILYYSHELVSIQNGLPQNMNFGDSLYLSLGLKNIGDQPAADLTAVISVVSPYVSITDSVESYGTMQPGEVKVIPEGYSFKVSDTIPDGLKVKFHVAVSSPDTGWTSHFTVEAHAPSLRITNFEINDASAGNGNGQLDPGETATLRITTANWGDFPCYNTFGKLSCESPFITILSDSSYLDTILPMFPKTAVFYLSVDEEAPTSMGLILNYTAVSGLYHTEVSFLQTIGIIVEDWETNSFLKFPWQHYGIKPWALSGIAPFEGSFCVATHPLNDSQFSTLEVAYTAGQDDSISFFRKVSSEPGYDFLRFYIDGVLQGSWSGDVAWGRVSFPVEAGTHTFRWKYIKDVYLAMGQDKAWLDFIEFPPPVLPDISAGPDGAVCAGLPYQLSGTASGQDSLKWITKGDGAFSNDTIPDPVYFHGPDDLLAGEVKLLLRGYVQYGSAVSGMMLTIGQIPPVSIQVDPKDTLCSWQTGTLSTDSVSGASYLWMPGGFTTPSIGIDTSVTGGMGTTQFTVTVKSLEGCSNADSVYITFKDCTAIGDLQNRFRLTIAPNPSSGSFELYIHTPVPETINLRIRTSSNAILHEETGIHVPNDLILHLDIRDPASGIYFLEIGREGGIVTEKVVVK